MDIDIIYNNSIGVSFKENDHYEDVYSRRYQLVINKIGFCYTLKKILEFKNCLTYSIQNNKCSCGSQLTHYMVYTPNNEITLSMNQKEVLLAKDLIEGTIHGITLDNYIENILL